MYQCIDLVLDRYILDVSIQCYIGIGCADQDFKSQDMLVYQFNFEPVCISGTNTKCTSTDTWNTGTSFISKYKRYRAVSETIVMTLYILAPN